jgi:DNA-directed RNA polymerase specialized sigma24 family protein
MLPSENEAGSRPAQAEWFQTTHWSVVLLAGHGGEAGARQALELLCRTYWYPLYAYVRRRGHGPEEAQDLTQEFFARLIANHDLARADREKGRFRSFLLAAMNHFLVSEWRKVHAAKRGGGQFVISLDGLTAEERYRREPMCERTPETLYEQRWALTLFDGALARLQQEWGSAGKAREFDRLKQFLTNEAGDGEYAQAATALDMTVGAVSVAVHRVRHRYSQLVREEIAHTVADPADLEDEVRHLFAVLRQ